MTKIYDQAPILTGDTPPQELFSSLPEPERYGALRRADRVLTDHGLEGRAADVSDSAATLYREDDEVRRHVAITARDTSMQERHDYARALGARARVMRKLAERGLPPDALMDQGKKYDEWVGETHDHAIRNTERYR